MRMISLKIATGILYYIIDAINLLYKTLIQYFWYNTISYGLSPSNAFLIPEICDGRDEVNVPNNIALIVISSIV